MTTETNNTATRLSDIESRVKTVTDRFINTDWVSQTKFVGGFVHSDTGKCLYCDTDYRLAQTSEHVAPSQEYTSEYHLHAAIDLDNYHEISTVNGNKVVAIKHGILAKEVSDLLVNSLSDLQFLLKLVKNHNC